MTLSFLSHQIKIAGNVLSLVLLFHPHDLLFLNQSQFFPWIPLFSFLCCTFFGVKSLGHLHNSLSRLFVQIQFIFKTLTSSFSFAVQPVCLVPFFSHLFQSFGCLCIILFFFLAVLLSFEVLLEQPPHTHISFPVMFCIH